MKTDFEIIGGEPVLRAIMNDFVDLVFDDAFIGFLFARADRERIKNKEYEHAARQLGASIEYTGRPMDKAHAPHRIKPGQFERRILLLQAVLEKHAVPMDVRERWVSHQYMLKPLVISRG